LNKFKLYAQTLHRLGKVSIISALLAVKKCIRTAIKGSKKNATFGFSNAFFNGFNHIRIAKFA